MTVRLSRAAPAARVYRYTVKLTGATERLCGKRGAAPMSNVARLRIGDPGWTGQGRSQYFVQEGAKPLVVQGTPNKN